MGILFYENICNDKYLNENDCPIYEYLVKESDKNSEAKKGQLIYVASLVKFVKDVQEMVYNEQKLADNNNKFEFKLNDFYNLLNDKNKLMNCSNIFKKQKEFKAEGEKKNYLFFPSFIYYINNNQNFINELFSSINNSDKSIIHDLYKKRKINYLPFWLYILRNITSLNCLEYGKKDIDKKVSEHIIDKIKKKYLIV